MKVCLYTTNFGGYGTHKPICDQILPEGVTLSKFVITDDAKLEFTGYKKILNTTIRRELCSRMKAKYFKMLAFTESELSGFDVYFYVDVSIKIHHNGFVAEVLKKLEKADMCIYEHPRRSDVIAEANESIKMAKYFKEPINEQVRYYRTRFGLHKSKLYAGGLFAFKKTPKLYGVMAEWFLENIRWSYQDQLSLPYILDKYGITVAAMDGNQYDKKYFTISISDREEYK